MGRANSYILTYGGDYSLANDYVIAHEMGHNVGLLADEYTEYQETYRGAESYARNVTALSDPALIPWKHLIAAGKEIPSVPGSSGVGLYDGAGYYTGGKYRPTEFCMMVSGDRYCPVCTEEIEIRLRDITGAVPDATPRAPAQTVSGVYPEFTWDAITGVSHFLFELEKADGSQLVASYDIYGTSFTLPFALPGGMDYRWRIRPASTASWGAWTAWVGFKAQEPAPLFGGTFAHIAAGGGYQTVLTAINLGQSTANVSVSLIKSDGTTFDSSTTAANLNVKPMGTARLDASLPGATVSGFARILSNIPISGTALFRTLTNGLIVSEAGIGFSRPGKRFTVYIDNLNDAVSGYAVANPGTNPANIALSLRDAAGKILENKSFSIPGGQHKAEFAYQRFATASAGFEGSIEFVSDQDVGAVALRYDNAAQDVFSSLPVLGDDAGTTIYFPQAADGGGYRTNLILVNPAGTNTSAKLEFFSHEGLALPFLVGGTPKTSHEVLLNSYGVTRFFTDGASADTVSGWIRVTSPTAISGSAIFQTLSGKKIISEAGVGSSPPAQHLITYVETLGFTQSGIAICNPNSSSVTLTINLRNESGETAASTSVILPANGHMAKFFTEWFPRGFWNFEGTLEVLATAPVSAVALRYDNPESNVFATLPVIAIP